MRDSGIGISPHDQERVVEEFRQAGEGSARAEGTGLGLPLAKSFVELHGGRIWVESELGVGSTFTFTLPQNTEPAAGADGSSGTGGVLESSAEPTPTPS